MRNENQRLINKFGSIRGRCNNPRNKAFKFYGERGIKCLWKSFKEFENDMLESYQAHVKEFGERQTTIERIDNDGNYCKENCKWATMAEQARNKRRNINLTFNGQTKSIQEWSKTTGIKSITIWHRVKMGCEIGEILSQERSKTKMSRNFVEYNGERKSIKEWAKILGIRYDRLHDRIYNRKWPVEKAFMTKPRPKRLSGMVHY